MLHRWFAPKDRDTGQSRGAAAYDRDKADRDRGVKDRDAADRDRGDMASACLDWSWGSSAQYVYIWVGVYLNISDFSMMCVLLCLMHHLSIFTNPCLVCIIRTNTYIYKHTYKHIYRYPDLGPQIHTFPGQNDGYGPNSGKNSDRNADAVACPFLARSWGSKVEVLALLAYPGDASGKNSAGGADQVSHVLMCLCTHVFMYSCAAVLLCLCVYAEGAAALVSVVVGYAYMRD